MTRPRGRDTLPLSMTKADTTRAMGELTLSRRTAHPLSTPHHPVPLPADYLQRILAYQLLFRSLAVVIYLADVFWWYARGTKHAYLSYLAYLIFWIPSHTAAMLALGPRGARGSGARRAAAILAAVAAHSLEAFVLISTVFNPQVWGADKLRFLVWPTATQGFANALMALFAFLAVLRRRQRGETRIAVADVLSTALPAADAAFVLSLLTVHCVPVMADRDSRTVLALTALLNLFTLHVRYLTFSRGVGGIAHLPGNTLFAAITLADAPAKGAELQRKMGLEIPGLEEEHERHDEHPPLQTAYLLHLARLVVTAFAWDAALYRTRITAFVAAHPYVAVLAFAGAYAAPSALRDLPQPQLAAAMFGVDALRGVALATVGGFVRWLVIALRFGVSNSERTHAEAQAQAVIVLTLLTLLCVRTALALSFFTTAPRGRAARGAVVALALAPWVLYRAYLRLGLPVSPASLLPYRWAYDFPTMGAGRVLGMLLFPISVWGVYRCAREVWTANADAAKIRGVDGLRAALLLERNEEPAPGLPTARQRL